MTKGLVVLNPFIVAISISRDVIPLVIPNQDQFARRIGHGGHDLVAKKWTIRHWLGK